MFVIIVAVVCGEWLRGGRGRGRGRGRGSVHGWMYLGREPELPRARGSESMSTAKSEPVHRGCLAMAILGLAGWLADTHQIKQSHISLSLFTNTDTRNKKAQNDTVTNKGEE